MSRLPFGVVRSALDELLDLDRARRTARLEEIGAEDPALRSKLESLLGRVESEVGPLESTLLEEVGSMVGRALDVEPELPATIGQYRVVRSLGMGGMGVVYLAQQERPRRNVAIKTLRVGVLSPSALRRFRMEVEVLGRLQHPGIARIYEAGVAKIGADELPFFAMEYIAGRPITDYARARELGLRDRIELFVRVCDAVQHAHTKGVIHRDIKPDNVLVEEGEGRSVSVLDFGIARATDSDVQLTTLRTDVGQLLGTLPYMSPEQVAGDAGEVDARSDVYALGVLLYELLSGSLPYDLGRRSIPEAARIIQEETPRSLSRYHTKFRGDLDTIVTRALEKDADRRYATAEALASDLRRFLGSEPIVARPPSTVYLAGKFVRRHRGLTVGTAVGVAALVIGLLVAIRFGLREADQRALAQRASYRMAMTTAYSSVREADPWRARELLDQSLPELRGWEWGFLNNQLDRRLWSAEVGPWGELETGTRAVAFGPAGEQLFAVSGPSSLSIFEGATGRRVEEREFGLQLDTRLLSVSDKAIALCSLDGAVLIADRAAEGAVRRIEVEHPVDALAWDPAGTRLAITLAAPVPDGDGQLELVVWTPSEGLRTVYRDRMRAPVIAWSDGGDRLNLGFDKSLRDCGVELRSSDWSVTRHLRAGLQEHGLHFRSLAAAAHGRRVLAGSTNRDLWLFSGGDSEDDVAEFLGDLHRGVLIESVALSDDGRRAVSTARGGTMVAWDVDRRLPLLSQDLAWTDGASVCCDIDPSGRRVAALAGDELRVWDLDSATATVLAGHGGFVYYLEYSPDGSQILSRDFDGELRLWDALEATPLARFQAPTPQLVLPWRPDYDQYVFSADGARIVGRLGGPTFMRFVEMDAVAETEFRALESDRPVDSKDDLDFRREVQGQWSRLAGRRPSVAQYPTSDDGRVGLHLESGKFTDSRGRVVGSLPPNDGDRWNALRSSSGSFSPDGSRVVVANRSTMVFDVPSGELVAEIPGSNGLVYSVAWSPDGERIAIGGEDSTVRVVDAGSFETILVLRGHSQYVHDVEWSPDGSQLASASGDRTVRLWDSVALSDRLATTAGSRELRARHRASVIEASRANDDPVEVAKALRADVGLAAEVRRASLDVLREHVYARAESEFGRLRSALDQGAPVEASALEGDGLARRFARRAVLERRAVASFGATPSMPADDPRSGHVWIGAGGTGLVAIDPETGEESDRTGELIGDAVGGEVTLVEVSPAGDELAVGVEAGNIDRWLGTLAVLDAATMELRGRWDGGRPESIAWRRHSPGAWLLESAFSYDAERDPPYAGPSTLVEWDGTGFHVALELDYTRSLSLSPDDRVLALARVASRDWIREARVELYDAQTLQLRATLPRSFTAAFAPDGDLAVARLDGRIELLDPQTLDVRRLVGRHVREASELLFSPDGRWLASAGRGAELRLWDLAREDASWGLPIDADVWRPREFSFSADSEALRWTTESGFHSMDLDSLTGVRLRVDGAETLRWLDGDRVAVAGREGTRVFSAAEGREVDGEASSLEGVEVPPSVQPAELEGQNTDLACIAADPRSSSLVGGNGRGELRFWDSSNGDLQLVIRAHDAPVRAVAVSPSGERIASLDDTGELAVWDARP